MSTKKMTEVKATNSESKTPTEITRESILESFSLLAEKLGRIPERQELKEQATYLRYSPELKKHINGELTRNVVENQFGSITNLVEKAMEAHPQKFQYVVEDKVYIPKAMAQLEKTVGNYKNFFISSVNGDAPVPEKILSGIRNFCKRRKAAALVIPTNGEGQKLPKSIHQAEDIHVVFEDIKLNNGICVSAMKIDPKQVNPLAGLNKMVRQNNASMIFGSPKLAMDSVACVPTRHPDVLISTGSISRPRYLSRKSGESKRRNVFADYEHMFAGIIVELRGNNKFFWRPVEIEVETGDFIDLGIRYCSNGDIELEIPEYQVYGDIHSYVKDEMAFSCAINIAKTLEIPQGVVHDIMDASSVSHHKAHRVAEKMAMTIAGDNNYGKEIDVLVKDFNILTATHSKKVRVVPSNHDDMDSRALEDGSFLMDNCNGIFGTILFPYQVAFDLVLQGYKNPAQVISKYMHIKEDVLKKRFPGIEKGIAPLQAAVEMNGPESGEKIAWHRRNDTLKAGRTELLQHGDRGANGAKFSIGTARTALGSSVTGHSHSSKILGHNMVVGHLAKKHQSYNAGGFSSWSHSVAHVYKNGSKQLITFIDGEYTNFNLKQMIAEAKASKSSRKAA